MNSIHSTRSASFRHLLKTFLPITFSLLSGSLLLFGDRAFLAHFSLDSLKACTAAVSICLFLQVPIMRMASMINPIVGNHIGEDKKHEAGSFIWQMIWIVLFSSLLTIPAGLLAVHFVLRKTLVEMLAIQYLQVMLPFNFLFPLGVVLSSFFIASGKRWLVLKITLSSHLLNFIFNYLLIFGVNDLIHPMGIRGAAIGTIIAQIYYCFILFYFFLNRENDEIFKTREFRVIRNKLFHIIRKWSAFGIAKLIMLLYWLIATRIMLINGESTTLVLSIGTTLFGCFIFINDGFNQAIITSASQIIGAKQWTLLGKLIQSSFKLLILIGLILSIPCIVFRKNLLMFFLHEPISVKNLDLLMQTYIWIWLFFLTDGFNRIFQSLLFASGDSIFHLFCQAVFCIFTTVIPIYYIIHYFHMSPDKFWLVIAMESFIFGIIFYLRIKGYATRNNLFQSEKRF